MTSSYFCAVLEVLDQVAALRGVQALRSLVQRGEEVDALLEVVSTESAGLREVPEMADALDYLAEHRATVERLAELGDLADDVERLARAMRAVRSHRDELEWAASEDWETAEEASQ